MESFTGPEIAALISTGCVIGSGRVFSVQLAEQVLLSPFGRMVTTNSYPLILPQSTTNTLCVFCVCFVCVLCVYVCEREIGCVCVCVRVCVCGGGGVCVGGGLCAVCVVCACVRVFAFIPMLQQWQMARILIAFCMVRAMFHVLCTMCCVPCTMYCVLRAAARSAATQWFA